MNYKVPKQSQYFVFEKKIENLEIEDSGEFSWTEKNKYMDDYIHYINKRGNLYRSLPFVESIYLCNSITFNALKKDSDIDLFIITKPGALWRARFRTVLLFTILGLKRSKKDKAGKFCLSFYVDSRHQNLYNIMLDKTDIYLSYWLAHLVPLYQENNNNIYKHNTWLKVILPNRPEKQIIKIGNKFFNQKTKFKKIIEFIFGGIVGKTTERLIKIARLPIVIIKTKELKEKGYGIITNNFMLKFHLDIRRKVAFLFSMKSKK